MTDLIVVERANHEPVIPGDFVQLRSGSPLGLATSVRGQYANVTWFAERPIRDCLPWVCLRPLPHG
jgi:hypothetical protein